MSHRQIVTDHLLLRWLERVEGYDFQAVRAAMERTEFDPVNDRETLDFIETYFGFDVEALRRELTDAVYAAIRMKASSLNYKGYRIMFKNGIAATVLERRTRRWM